MKYLKWLFGIRCQFSHHYRWNRFFDYRCIYCWKPMPPPPAYYEELNKEIKESKESDIRE